MTREERLAIAREIGRKLSLAKGKVAVVVPARGLSIPNVPGGPFHDPEGDAAFRAALRDALPASADYREVDAHVNDDAFADVPRLRLRLFDDEMVGLDRLRVMATELYGERHPIEDFTAHSPFRISEDGGVVTMELDIPFIEKAELDVFRQGNELYVRAGPYRRSFLLPDALHRREVASARHELGTLRVDFADPGKKR